MKLTKTFLKRYNLSMTHFAKLAGVSGHSVKKYLNKDKLSERVTLKIEETATNIKKFDKTWPYIVICKQVQTHEELRKNQEEGVKLDQKFVNFADRQKRLK